MSTLRPTPLIVSLAACWHGRRRRLGADCSPPPQNVVSLSASATIEVTKDLLTVVFSTTREGADAAAVQSQLRQALDAALAEARKAARPGQLEVQHRRLLAVPALCAGTEAPQGPASPAGRAAPSWWSKAATRRPSRQLTGRIQTLTIARVGYSLSREAREKVEAEVAAQAIARFRARADAVSRQFGFGGYTRARGQRVVATSRRPMPTPMMRAPGRHAAPGRRGPAGGSRQGHGHRHRQRQRADDK